MRMHVNKRKANWHSQPDSLIVTGIHSLTVLGKRFIRRPYSNTQMVLRICIHTYNPNDYLPTYIHTYTHTHTEACAHTAKHTLTRAHLHTLSTSAEHSGGIRLVAFLSLCFFVCCVLCACVCVSACVRARSCVHACMHACMHACTIDGCFTCVAYNA